MAEDKIWVTNIESGLPAFVPAEWLDHPTLGLALKASRSGKPVVRLTEPAVSDAEIASLEAAEAEKPADKKKED